MSLMWLLDVGSFGLQGQDSGTLALVNPELGSALRDTKVLMRMEYPLIWKMKEWNKERFCHTVHRMPCLSPEQHGIPVPAVLQLAEKLVGSVLWGLFTSRLAGLFGGFFSFHGC